MFLFKFRMDWMAGTFFGIILNILTFFENFIYMRMNGTILFLIWWMNRLFGNFRIFWKVRVFMIRPCFLQFHWIEHPKQTNIKIEFSMWKIFIFNEVYSRNKSNIQKYKCTWIDSYSNMMQPVRDFWFVYDLCVI